MKGTGAKRNVCLGSCVSTGAKFPVVPMESAPVLLILPTAYPSFLLQDLLHGFSGLFTDTSKHIRFQFFFLFSTF